MTARLVSLTLLLSLLCPVSLLSESPGTITGTVLDPARAPLPRVTVQLLAAGGAELARTRTDTQGRFRFEGLSPTSYTVLVELVGFERFTQSAAPGASVEAVLAVRPVRERVVVTATRTEAPSAQVGASTTVLTGEELSRGVMLGELLRPVPGAAVVRSGASGALTSLFVRGGENDHNKVLLDGIVLNEPGGTYFFSNLTAENLERVEVVRGPQSALFGSDAVASVVQLFTRRGEAETARPRFSFSLEGGNHASWLGRAAVSGEAGRFDYSLAAARFDTDNQEPNNHFRNSTLSASFGLALREATSLRVILRGELGQAGTPGQTAFGRPDLDAFFHRGDTDFGVTLRDETAGYWDQRLTYAYAQSRQVSRNLLADPPFVPSFEGRTAPFPFFDFTSDFLNHTQRHHVSYQSDWRAGAAGSSAGQHFFTFAFEWDRELGLLGERLFPSPAVEAERDNFGTVFQHQALWGRLYLTNGVRVEDNASFGTTVVPRSSLAYFLRTGGGALGATKFKFNFGLGVKEPTLVESFSPGPFVVGNARLAPERTRSFDFGVEQRFWADRAKLEVNWFDNRFRDLIGFEITSFTPFFTGSFFNLGRTKAKGAEVVLELAPGKGLHGRGTYTFLDSQVTESGTVFDPVFEAGNRLLRRPKPSGALQLFWDWKRLTVVSTAVFVGRRTDSDFSLLGLTSNPGYTKWDLGASYRSPHRVTYFAAVENLLNREYMEVLGFPALKLAVRAGARLEF